MKNIEFHQEAFPKCWYNFQEQLEGIGDKLPQDLTIALDWGTIICDGHIRMRSYQSCLPICFETPLIGRPWFRRDGEGDPVRRHFRIALWDATSLGGGFVIPENPGAGRFSKFIDDFDLHIKPMKRSTHARDHLLYVTQVPRDGSLKGLNVFEAAMWDLFEIRRRSHRHVVVTIHPNCTSAGWAKARFSADQAQFHDFCDFVHYLGYSLIMDGSPSSNFFNDCAAVITQSSGTAFEALIEGVPTIALHRGSFLSPVCPGTLEALSECHIQISDEVRNTWFNRVSYVQWSVEEIESGAVLNHYLNYIREQALFIINRPAGRRTREVFNNFSSSEKVSISVAGRQLMLNMEWKHERELRSWHDGTKSNDRIAMLVWAMSCIVTDNDCVVIAGGGIGFSSLVALGSGAAEVIAFEADYRNSERLKNLEHYGIQAIPLALSCISGDVFLAFAETANDRSSLLMGRIDKSPNIFVSRMVEKTKSTRLDEVCENIDIDILLIDVEGAEGAVIEGATKILKRSTLRAVIVVASEEGWLDAKEALTGFYSHYGRIETGDGGWCRLLGDNIESCGRSEPHIYVFCNADIFKILESWSPPKAPCAVFEPCAEDEFYN